MQTWACTILFMLDNTKIEGPTSGYITRDHNHLAVLELRM